MQKVGEFVAGPKRSPPSVKAQGPAGSSFLVPYSRRMAVFGSTVNVSMCLTTTLTKGPGLMLVARRRAFPSKQGAGGRRPVEQLLPSLPSSSVRTVSTEAKAGRREGKVGLRATARRETVCKIPLVRGISRLTRVIPQDAEGNCQGFQSHFRQETGEYDFPKGEQSKLQQLQPVSSRSIPGRNVSMGISQVAREFVSDTAVAQLTFKMYYGQIQVSSSKMRDKILFLFLFFSKMGRMRPHAVV